MPRRYKQGADGQPHPAFYGKLPEEFSKADTMRFMVETDLKLSGCVSADTLAALRAEGYDYARKRADLSATALFQQSQSGRRTRTHLWRVPGGNRRIVLVPGQFHTDGCLVDQRPDFCGNLHHTVSSSFTL